VLDIDTVKRPPCQVVLVQVPGNLYERLLIIGIFHLSVYTVFEKACIIELGDGVETGNSKLGNAFISLCFSQFQISNFITKIQDQ